MADETDDIPLNRTQLKDIRTALHKGWSIGDEKRLALVEKLYSTAMSAESERGRIMAIRTILEMHKADQACAMKLLDKEQPDKHEHEVKTTTVYLLPDNGR